MTITQTTLRIFLSGPKVHPVSFTPTLRTLTRITRKSVIYYLLLYHIRIYYTKARHIELPENV